MDTVARFRRGQLDIEQLGKEFTLSQIHHSSDKHFDCGSDAGMVLDPSFWSLVCGNVEEKARCRADLCDAHGVVCCVFPHVCRCYCFVSVELEHQAEDGIDGVPHGILVAFAGVVEAVIKCSVWQTARPGFQLILEVLNVGLNLLCGEVQKVLLKEVEEVTSLEWKLVNHLLFARALSPHA